MKKKDYNKYFLTTIIIIIGIVAIIAILILNNNQCNIESISNNKIDDANSNPIIEDSTGQVIRKKPTMCSTNDCCKNNPGRPECRIILER